MTRKEFMIGWSILVLQPWGWRYSKVGADGRPTADSLAQIDFYFTKLSWAHPQAWSTVAEMYAEGKDWPSVQELRLSLQAINARFIKSLTDQTEKEYCECPEDVQAILDRVRDGKTFSFPADQKEGTA